MSYLRSDAVIILCHIFDKPNVTAEEIADFPYLYTVEEKHLLDMITRFAEKGLLK